MTYSYFDSTFYVLKENGKPICLYFRNTAQSNESWTMYKTSYMPEHYTYYGNFSPFLRCKDLELISLDEFQTIASKDNALSATYLPTGGANSAS